jgi:hypothetical protein
MKRPSRFQYIIAAIIGLTLVSVVWFVQAIKRLEMSVAPVSPVAQAPTTRTASRSATATEDPASGKTRMRDDSTATPRVDVVELNPEQVLAMVKNEPILLRHLMPVGEDDAQHILTPEEYASRLQRAIDMEVVFQAAKDAGVELTEAQQKRRDAVSEISQAELAHYKKHGLTWSTTGPEQVEFEQRLLTAHMLEQNLVLKATALQPSADPAIQARYESARLDLLKQLHAAANVAITRPATGP